MRKLFYVSLLTVANHNGPVVETQKDLFKSWSHWCSINEPFQFSFDLPTRPAPYSEGSNCISWPCIIHIHKSLLRCMLYMAPIVHKFAQFNFANTFVFNLFSGAQTLRLVGSLQTETWDVRFATKNHAFTKLAFLSSFYISSFANFWFRHMVEISQVWWFLFLALVQQVF